MEVVAVVIVAVAVFVTLKVLRKDGPATTPPQPPSTPYVFGDELDDGEFKGRIEAVSRNGQWGAGYCVSSTAVFTDDDDMLYRSILAIVHMDTRDWVAVTNGPMIDFDSAYPAIAAVSDDGTVYAVFEADTKSGLKERIVACDRHGGRLWSKTLTPPGKPQSLVEIVETDQIDVSPNGYLLFAEWLGLGVALLDANTGKQRWITRWQDHEIGLDVEFGADNSLVAHFSHEGPAGILTDEFTLDQNGKLPPDYYTARDAAVKTAELADYRVVLPRVKALLRKAPPDSLSAATLISGVLPYAEQIPSRYRAVLLRYQGEIAHAKGEVPRALDLWEQALGIDPKVGIQGRYGRERKKLEKAAAAAELPVGTATQDALSPAPGAAARRIPSGVP